VCVRARARMCVCVWGGGQHCPPQFVIASVVRRPVTHRPLGIPTVPVFCTHLLLQSTVGVTTVSVRHNYVFDPLNIGICPRWLWPAAARKMSNICMLTFV
jgi:hypothetical protein